MFISIMLGGRLDHADLWFCFSSYPMFQSADQCRPASGPLGQTRQDIGGPVAYCLSHPRIIIKCPLTSCSPQHPFSASN